MSMLSYMVLATAFAPAGSTSVASVAHQQMPTAEARIDEAPIAGFPHARLYRVAGAKRRPVIVILAGAEGGDDAGRRFGPILARLGYAAVSLPYYSPNWGKHAPPPAMPELPGSFIDIRVDQLVGLRKALAATPGLDIDRFALFAGSKGSEFALIAASRYRWIDAVVAYAPSNLVWEGWGLETLEAEGTRSSFSFEGKPLDFMPYRGFVDGLQLGPAADLRAIHENGRAAFPGREAAARIRVERFAGALMVVAGDKDRLWDSSRMARAIASSRTASGLKTEALIYVDAGHDIAGGSGELRDDKRGGGSPQANAAARLNAWPRVVAFLERSLRP